MTAVAPATIRQGVATALDAVTGFRESRWPFDLIAFDPKTYVHKSFAVGLGRTQLVQQTDRQRLSVGAYVRTQVLARFLWRIRGNRMRADYDLALGGELSLVAAAKGSPPTNTHIVFEEVLGRELLSEDHVYFVGTIAFRVLHHYALS